MAKIPKTFKLKGFKEIDGKASQAPGSRYFEPRLTLPLLPLRENLLFPGASLPVTQLSDLLSPSQLKKAESGLLRVLAALELPGEGKEEDRTFFPIGVEADISGLLRLPDGSTGAVLNGVRRVRIESVEKEGQRFSAVFFVERETPEPQQGKYLLQKNRLRKVIKGFLSLQSGLSSDLKLGLENTEHGGRLCDLVAPLLTLTLVQKKAILSELSIPKRLALVLDFIAKEKDLYRMNSRLSDEIHTELEDSERRYFLKEQIRSLKKELGDLEGTVYEVDQLEAKFEKSKLPPMVKEVVREEIERMQMQGTGSPEYMTSHAFVSLALDLPWFDQPKKKTLSLSHAQEVLDASHYGMVKAKEKILEHIAVMLFSGKHSGRILLLLGPPGVGKTSLACSMAAALERPFARIPLGGVRDEAEIRGHRRTYVGAMCGKLIQAMRQTGSKYPLILLDEIDKVGRDQENIGPYPALLEVLDPQQNKEFLDHYLSVPFDLSGVVFIATANDIDAIPSPLLDRMDVIELRSYSTWDKLRIVRSYLLPQVRKEMGLRSSQFQMTDNSLKFLISEYTREAGVRQLRRELGHLAAKVVRRVVEKRRLLPLKSPQSSSSNS